MGPWDWWIGARIQDLSLLNCTLICVQGPCQGQCVAGAQGLLGRKTGIHLPSALVQPRRRNGSSLGQLHAGHGVALKTMRWSLAGIHPTLPWPQEGIVEFHCYGLKRVYGW